MTDKPLKRPVNEDKWTRNKRLRKQAAREARINSEAHSNVHRNWDV